MMRKENINLINFTVLSYIDKGLSFVLPLSVLYIYKDQESYNDLEYAYSIANIVVYLFSVGSMYSFYGYREAANKQDYVHNYLSLSSTSLLVTSIVTFMFIIIRPEFGKEIGTVVYVLIAARILFLLFINFFSLYYRLIDKPSGILVYTIAVSVIIILTMGVFMYLSYNILYAFALPEFLLPIITCLYFIAQKNRVKWSYLGHYYRKAIIYAWPLLLNCLLSLGVNNYGKIYAFNYMTSDDMYVFSFTLRISMIIGMAHTSILAFYSKHIYTNKFTNGIALKYGLFLISSAVLSYLIIILLNSFLPKKLPLDLTLLMIFLYNIVFYAGSFCEAFYGRANKNERILLYSLISAVFFALLIMCLDNMTILSISMVMLTYAIIRFILLFSGIIDIRNKYESTLKSRLSDRY